MEETSPGLRNAWAKGDKSSDDGTMKLPNGTTMANELQQLHEIGNAWRPIFQKFKDKHVLVEQFMDCFGSLKAADMTLHPLTGPDIMAGVALLPLINGGLKLYVLWRIGTLVSMTRWLLTLKLSAVAYIIALWLHCSHP